MPDAKIKSKDLSYEPTLPPFLQRLHAQKAGRSGDPDRHEQAIARPKKAKKEDEDDGPTIVDESGEMIKKEELEKMNGSNADGKSSGEVDVVGSAPKDGAQDTDIERRADGQKIADGSVATASKKRKVAKVVVDDDEAGDHDKTEANGEEKVKPIKKSKRKAKPIKLAFAGDDEEVP